MEKKEWWRGNLDFGFCSRVSLAASLPWVFLSCRRRKEERLMFFFSAFMLLLFLLLLIFVALASLP